MFIVLAAGPGITSAAEPLTSVVVRESSVYGPPQLFAVYQEYLGKPADESTARTIAETVQRKYVADGYSRPGFAVRDTGTRSGIARIELVEAKVSRVEITGNAGPYRRKLESLVGNLDSPQSLRPEDVRDVLRRARQFPGLAVSVATEPDGTSPGGYVLAFDSAFKPLEGGVTLSNRGTREIGRELLTARLVSNGLFGAQSAAGLFVTTAKDSDNYRGGGLFSSTALGDGGALLGMQGAVTSLDIETQGIPVQQRRERFLVNVSRPLPDWGMRKLKFTAGTVVENLDLIQNSLASREERLRSLQAGLTVNWRTGDAQQLVNFELEQGLNGFGSRIDNYLSPDDGPRTDFTIARLGYIHLLRLDDSWILRWDALAQQSPHVLPSIKRFKVGGGRIGRGFDAAAASGDRGIGNKIELRRRMADVYGWLSHTDVYGYFDLGTTWRNDRPGRESASSTGLGVAVNAERLSGYLELARPLTHADVDGREDIGIFAELAFRF